MSATPTDMTRNHQRDKTGKAFELKLPSKLAPWLIGIPVAWVILVFAQGVAAYQGVDFLGVDFSLSGQFGDSFGGLSATMASAAALGAWAAVSEQRAATSASEEAASKLERSARKRDFESTFFNLLSTFLRLSEGIDVGPAWSRKTGKDAFSEFVKQIYSSRNSRDEDFENAYLLTFFRHEDDLAHYIRNLFNLILFVKENCPDQTYSYVRIVRSTLSQPELVVLALNGMYHDEGAEYFKPVIQEFALLNNISDQAKADFDLEAFYGPQAFRPAHARQAD